jgi:hypothetical protein
MKRRKFLKYTTASTVFLTGCTGGSPMAEDIVEVVENRSETEVLEYERTTDGIEIEASTQETYSMTLSIFGGSYSGVVGSYDTDAPLIAEVYVAPDDQSYLIEIEADWARQFTNDEMPESEYISRIDESTVPVS